MSTFKRYIRIQLQMFMFGIVGPIFLVVYFAAEPDPPKWLYWWGLMITAVDVLIALGVTNSGATPRPSTGREGRQETALHQKAIRLVQGHHR